MSFIGETSYSYDGNNHFVSGTVVSLADVGPSNVTALGNGKAGTPTCRPGARRHRPTVRGIGSGRDRPLAATKRYIAGWLRTRPPGRAPVAIPSR
jgi:hypothetical protein